MRSMIATILGFIAALTASVAGAATLPSVSSGQLVIRLDAALGVTKDGSSNVSAWVDQTGTSDQALGFANRNYGGTFVNSGGPGGSTPTWTANAIKGNPTISFNAGDYLRSTFDPGVNLGGDDNVIDYTFFFVTRSATDYRGLFDGAPGIAGPFRFLNPGKFTNQNEEGPTNGLSVVFDPNPISGATVLSIVHDGSVGANTRSWEGFVNGQSYAGSVVTDPGRRSAWKFSQIGMVNSGDAQFNGEVAEILVYAGALSSADRTAVETYLSDKYLPEPGAAALVVVTSMIGCFQRRRDAHA